MVAPAVKVEFSGHPVSADFRKRSSIPPSSQRSGIKHAELPIMELGRSSSPPPASATARPFLGGTVAQITHPTQETKLSIMDITTRTRHLIQHLPDQRTRLLIEWTPPFRGNVRPVAIRHCFDDEGCLDRMIGATLGFDHIHPCVLFLLVREGDLVSVGEKTIGGTSASWIHYQVGPDFALKRINIGGRTLTAAEIRAWLSPAVTSYHQPPGCDESLREFLADPNHPAWLVPILERQKQKWRTRRISKFYHLAPSEASREEIDRIMKLAPGAALRFFSQHLTKGQIKRCIRRDLKTAVLHAYETMSPDQLDVACREHPVLLLQHQGSNLPEPILLRCVRFEPFEAFRIRNRFSAPVHAKILAATCELPFGLFRSGDISSLPAEIETSFRQFPGSWVESFGRDFGALFQALERQGRMKVDHAIVHFLMNVLPPQHLPSLDKFISKQL
jgi:hypothetical protein